MPSTPYDLVQDEQDLRLPLHAEQAFFHGITFQAKFIGWEEVPRPNTRVEIVQAMRRIRYESKVQNLKKRKVTVHVSIHGVRVVLKKRHQKKKNWSKEPEEIELLNHPIYRIFYVSHDSSDLKIFSYIARDASTDTFKCSVFKSHKKSQAMRIVRTIGQAFEVCHKFSFHKNSLDHNDEQSDASSEPADVDRIIDQQLPDGVSPKKNKSVVTSFTANNSDHPNTTDMMSHSIATAATSAAATAIATANVNSYKALKIDNKKTIPTKSADQEIIELKEQLEQQSLQTRQALTQLMLLREQLISETNARIEAQARTQQLLQQNRELLDHLASLGPYTEQQVARLSTASMAMSPQSKLQMLLQAANNNNLTTLNQQINSLGSINQQLSSLSHQLSGLNQQNESLHGFQNIGTSAQQQENVQVTQQQTVPLTPPTGSLNKSQLHLNVSSASQRPSLSGSSHTLSSSSFRSTNQLPNLNSQLQQISARNLQQQHDGLSKDLLQVNQDLLSRLQALNLSTSSTNVGDLSVNGSTFPMQPTSSSHSSYFFVNPMSNNNNSNPGNFNFMSSPISLGNFSNSSMEASHGILNMNPTTEEIQVTTDKNISCISDKLLKPLSQTFSTSTSNDNLSSHIATRENSCTPSIMETSSVPQVDSHNLSINNNRNNNNEYNKGGSSGSNELRLNTVTLKVTDEAGNVTNHRKLSATPSFITRSTSEKVPNRSQMMSHMQRTAWARHTTK